MTVRAYMSELTAALTRQYGEREAASIARLFVGTKTGLSNLDLILKAADRVEIPDFDAALEALKTGRPVQYVLGTAEFAGLTLHVEEGVLIPRPETEELVRWAASTRANNILDIGTGSGAIAIALKHLLPEAQVTAVDLSEKALEIAHQNAERLHLDIQFIRADALDLHLDRTFDLIVSNPPYIPASERLPAHVRNFEPAQALFVPDDDPLLFYRAIRTAAETHLTADGKIFLEFHENHDPSSLFPGAEVRRDMNGKPRMLCCKKPKSKRCSD